ncbi:MAG TPA: L-histidine N(alpha)-methyltransferase [Patescibacteria group bacterium]|nr:L-histidine N(alpha)-methyltransferase [Patescibacteria group bacterium]
MRQEYEVLQQSDIENITNEAQEFAQDVLLGLSQPCKELSSKYLYDTEGSRLFEKIMELKEYYPTNCELEILKEQTADFAALFKTEEFQLVELGAGDGRKTKVLLEHFLKEKLKFRYVPVDISEGAMKTLTQRLQRSLPRLRLKGIVAEYFDALKWIEASSNERNVILFMGGNIGNFTREQARNFLRSLWNVLNNGDLVIIGMDLKKDPDVMLSAYSDSEGVTAQFNLNLLKRINRELGGDFDLGKFQHYANYNAFLGTMESYIVSREVQDVRIEALKKSFHFDAWEAIHTEYSFKYSDSDIQKMAAETGFSIVNNLYDSQKYFVDSVWQVEKK